MKRLLSHPTVRTHAPQLLKFALSGGIGSIIDLGTLTLLTHALAVSEEVAFLVSSFAGATCVFVINKVFTFKNADRRIVLQLLKFYTVYGPAIVANFFLSSLLFWFGAPAVIAKFFAIGIIAVVNYLLSHHYVFRVRD